MSKFGWEEFVVFTLMTTGAVGVTLHLLMFIARHWKW